MRTHLPVTGQQRALTPGKDLISTTDLHGIILSVNDEFARISGFSAQELIGQPHNIVRHPDMPSLVFADLWHRLKAGKDWMGVVKNRCKNGDHYWVDAYITPVFEQQKMIGFQSVRRYAEPELIERAQRYYQHLSAKSVLKSGWSDWQQLAVGQVLVFSGLAVLWLCSGALLWQAGGLLLAAAVSLVLTYGVSARARAVMSRLRAQYHSVHRLAVYGGRVDDAALLQVCVRQYQARNHSLLSRLQQMAQSLTQLERQNYQTVQANYQQLDVQQNAIEQVAAAMAQMSATLNEVANTTQQTQISAEAAQHRWTDLADRNRHSTTAERGGCHSPESDRYPISESAGAAGNGPDHWPDAAVKSGGDRA